jgi:hypothetical protein
VTDSEVDFEGSITMTSSPWPVHLVGVGEVEANTGKLQNDCQRDCWLASTGPDQAEGYEKSKHDECKHSLPPDSAWNFSGDRLLGKWGVFNLFADPKLVKVETFPHFAKLCWPCDINLKKRE